VKLGETVEDLVNACGSLRPPIDKESQRTLRLQAVQAFERALQESKGESVAAAVGLARCRFSEGLDGVAEQLAQDVLAKYSEKQEQQHGGGAVGSAPEVCGAHRLLGMIYSAQRRPDEALRCFIMAQTMDPEAGEAVYHMGNCLMELNRLKVKHLAVAPLPPLTHTVCVSLSQEAEAAYLRAVDFLPDFGEAHYNLALLRDQKGRPHMARLSYERAAELRPYDPDPWINLGTTLMTLGNLTESTEAYDHALALDPTDASIHFSRGLTLLRRCLWAQARAAFEEATRLEPEHADAHYHVAVCAEAGELGELGDGQGKEAEVASTHSLSHPLTNTV
jgi:tetratricopeptide (TPR) repeat protein